jgi:GNAT superfamily N-acetyltransferase
MLVACCQSPERERGWLMSAVVDPVNYSLFTASDADEMSRLLGEVFADRDPPAVAVGLTASEFETFVRLFCSKAAAEGLTIVARSAGTGEMIGALLAEDAASEPPAAFDQLSAKLYPIFDILGQLDAEYRGGAAIQSGESIDLFLLGVGRSSAGKGVGQRLVMECVANARRKGYRRAVTEATNRTSQHVFRKLGLIDRVQRSYDEHRFRGRAFFSSIAAAGGPILMDTQLIP